jgi:hypothetical protein
MYGTYAPFGFSLSGLKNYVMKTLLAFQFSYLFTVITVFAQPVIQWQKCLGGSSIDNGTCIQPTTDGGYILSGITYSSDGDLSGNLGGGDAWVVKLNATGAIQWQKSFGGSNFEYIDYIKPTGDGGYIMAGSTRSNDGDVSGNHGGLDAWVVKLNSTGAIQWQRCLGGSGDEYAWFIETTSDGGYILAGFTNSNNGDVSGNHGNEDAWVVKLNSLGAIQWQKCLGGSGGDEAFSVQSTNDGGCIIAGDTDSNDGDVSGNHGGGADAWVVKLDSSGGIQWQKCLGGSGADEAFFIQIASDGGYIMTGFSSSDDGDISGNHGKEDAWVVKLNSIGAIQWQKCLGGSINDEGYSIQPTSDGGYAMTGYSYSNDGDVSGNQGKEDAWVVKLSSTGAIQWQKCLGGSNDDAAVFIQSTSDGGYVMAGTSSSNDGDASGNHGGGDFWVVKLSTPTGTADIQDNLNWEVFPNPTTGILEIQMDDNNPFVVSILDLLGRKLIEQETVSNKSIDMSNLPNGVYIVQALSQAGKIDQKKIVKQ